MRREENKEEDAGLSELELQMQQVIKRFEKLEKEHQRTAKEKRRLEIITEGSKLLFLTSRNPADRSSMSRRVLSEKAGERIKFKVLGIRWTSKKVQALVGSFVATVIGVVWHKYSGLR